MEENQENETKADIEKDINRLKNDPNASQQEIQDVVNRANDFGIDASSIKDRLNDNTDSQLNANNNYTSADGKTFNCRFANGKFIAKDLDGNTIEADNNYELNNKLAQAFKNQSKNKDRIPSVTFNAGKNEIGGVSIEQSKRDFAKAFIMNGIIPKGDIPQDKEFWQQLKNEYLSNKENSPQMWNTLTQHIPDEIVGRQKSNPKKELTKHLMDLRNGVNHKLTPPKGQSFIRNPQQQQQFSKDPNDWKIDFNNLSR